MTSKEAYENYGIGDNVMENDGKANGTCYGGNNENRV